MIDEMDGRMYTIPEDFCALYHYCLDMVLIRTRMPSMICSV